MAAKSFAEILRASPLSKANELGEGLGKDVWSKKQMIGIGSTPNKEGTTMKVYSCISAITAALSKIGISKTSENEQQGYKFRGIDAVYGALSKLLAEHGLCILPRVVNREVTERATRNGGTLFYTVLTVEYDFVAIEDGSTHTIIMVGEAMDSGDKSSNKAMSAAYKYACIQAFCIPTQGDNDADATTYEVASPSEIVRKAFADALLADEFGTTEEEQEEAKAQRVYRIHVAANDQEVYRAAWKELDSKQRSAIKKYIELAKLKDVA